VNNNVTANYTLDKADNRKNLQVAVSAKRDIDGLDKQA